MWRQYHINNNENGGEIMAKEKHQEKPMAKRK